jgi:cob(I)alamin adenosyltransferase
MKLYTKTGDDGTTGLFGGERVAKDSLRVEAYGTVDELNAALGSARCVCGAEELAAILARLQEMMFELGADLSTPKEVGRDRQPVRITPGHVGEMEAFIDAACAPLEPLKSFILPGGSELAARLHIARTIARRAERVVVALVGLTGQDGVTVQLLNRVSDLLFAMARRANQLCGVADIPWKGNP